ncbi:MAG TPA: YcaO-like family protein [Polyangiaceae bacterium]|nr:YcaO-like family protein [Polyangiaceae bacterium]
MTAKRHTQGTHRIVAPEETRARLRPLLLPLGITRVANITGLDCIGVPVVAVYRPNSRSLSVAQGKGFTPVAAEVSGVMEALEMHHAENVERPLLHGSHAQLGYAHRLVDPECLPASSASRWHADLKLLWIEGVDLLSQEACWVPYELVHTDFTLPLPAGSGCFPMSSNGLASGNHLWEAVSHGICEVVERDAATLMSLMPEAEREARRLDPASVDDATCRELLARFEAAGIRSVLFDMTTDVGIPAFRAVIMDAELEPERPLAPSTGTGCHPTRAVALARALTEAAQSRLTVIAGSRDDLPRARYADATDLKALDERRERLLRGEARRAFRDVSEFEADDVEADVLWLSERLASVGIARIIVVDLTKPEFGVPVARVLVPGLEAGRHLPGWLPGPRASALLARQAA